MEQVISSYSVSIVILNYNGGNLTSECLRSLYRHGYDFCETIVVDNGSTDDSIEHIKKNFPNVKIVQNKKNLGFAQGNNIGFKKATSDLILFLNNDTLVEKNFLEPLVEKIFSDSMIGGVQPKILNYPNTHIIDSVGSYFIPSGFLYHYGHNKKDKNKLNKESNIFSMKGACMLFKREVLEKVGLFGKEYFAYFEETDLCMRTLIAGYSIVFNPDSVIYHKGGQTAVKLGDPFIQYHSYKNRIYTYVKNFETKTVFKVLLFHLLLCELASFAYFITFQFSYGIAIQKALAWNLFSIKKILKERKKIEKLRKLSDNDYLPQLTRNVGLSYYYHLFATALAGYKD